MNEDQLILLTTENKEVKIPLSHVERVQGFDGIHTSDIGGVSIAAGSYQYVEVKTTSSSFKIARNAENDSQLLTFMLSQGKRAV
ncbi:hypothetical protein EKO29_02050 [Colwellia sp. Arc7-635]|uniref:hypothetical protein n=1 Tax=Colwellia sp. Arc7-635 TaxID=2497879 RepID=UPI000F858D5C|nr:hypothetical protein [Colwellia sp. Arc7-635]AZQ82947.1 hypothetical protein EKO29_02050 [Colwellia sp. Arc7-635]